MDRKRRIETEMTYFDERPSHHDSGIILEIAHRLMLTSLYIMMNIDCPAVGRNIRAGFIRSRQLAIRETRNQLQWAGLRTLCDARIAKCRGLPEEALICTVMKKRRVANMGGRQTAHDNCKKTSTSKHTTNAAVLAGRMGPHGTRA